MGESEDAADRLQAALAEGIADITDHFVGRMKPEHASEITSKVHGLVVRLREAGLLPQMELGRFSAKVHNTDPTRVIVTFPPELVAVFDEYNVRRAKALAESHASPAPVSDYSSFHGRVYDRDNAKSDSHGWIQWKGTDVCMDMHCECGAHGHLDESFAYFYRCTVCGATYAVGQVVKLIKLEGEDLRYVEAERDSMIKTDEDAERD